MSIPNLKQVADKIYKALKSLAEVASVKPPKFYDAMKPSISGKWVIKMEVPEVRTSSFFVQVNMDGVAWSGDQPYPIEEAILKIIKPLKISRPMRFKHMLGPQGLQFLWAGNYAVHANLQEQVQKLANDNPEMRKHLVPILKQAGGGIYQIFFDMFGKAFKKSCTEMYGQFYRDYSWDDIEGVSSSIKPGLWEVVSKYGPMVAVSYHAQPTKLTITCSLRNLRHRMEEERQVVFLEKFLAKDMTEKDMQAFIMKFVISCAKKTWRG